MASVFTTITSSAANADEYDMQDVKLRLSNIPDTYCAVSRWKRGGTGSGLQVDTPMFLAPGCPHE